MNCAIAMNTVSKHIINKHFRAGEVSCGIGIDAGNMLATKTGVRRHGFEQGNYRNLVWLGRPANIASKLTDSANKPAETVQEKVVDVAYDMSALNQLGGLFGLSTPPANSLGASLAGPPPSPSSNLYSALVQGLPPGNPRPEWQWKEETLGEFLSKVEVKYVPSRLVHSDPNFVSFYLTERTRVARDRTLGEFLSKVEVKYVPSRLVHSDPNFVSFYLTERTRVARDRTLGEFLSKVEVKYVPSRLVHSDPNFVSFYLTERTRVARDRTPPILLTARVWKGFRSEQPDDPIIKNGWFKRVGVKTPGLTEAVFGGDVIFPVLKD